AHNNGGAGTGEPWTLVAASNAPPAVPTGADRACSHRHVQRGDDAELDGVERARRGHGHGLRDFRERASDRDHHGDELYRRQPCRRHDLCLRGRGARCRRLVRRAGGDVTISFGGAAGQEAALTAMTAANLQAEYQSVIDRYHVHSLDFDIEGAAVADQRSLTLRDQALVGLKAANPGLNVSFTLPVLPTGLTADGLNVLASAKHDGLNVDLVNIMTMDYGASVDNGGQMGVDAINATIATEKQIGSLGLSSKIGITP